MTDFKDKLSHTVQAVTPESFNYDDEYPDVTDAQSLDLALVIDGSRAMERSDPT